MMNGYPVSALEHLLEEGASTKTVEGRHPPIMFAVRGAIGASYETRLEYLHTLIKWGANVNDVDPEGFCCLIHLIWCWPNVRGDWRRHGLQKYVDALLDVPTINLHAAVLGKSALQWAEICEWPEMAQTIRRMQMLRRWTKLRVVWLMAILVH